MIQEHNFNVGKPTDMCKSCGGTLVRYCNANDTNTYQACPDCDDV